MRERAREGGREGEACGGGLIERTRDRESNEAAVEGRKEGKRGGGGGVDQNFCQKI